MHVHHCAAVKRRKYGMRWEFGREDSLFIVPGKAYLAQFHQSVIFELDLSHFFQSFFTLPNDTVHANLPHKCLIRNQFFPVVTIKILRDDPTEHSFAIFGSTLE